MQQPKRNSIRWLVKNRHATLERFPWQRHLRIFLPLEPHAGDCSMPDDPNSPHLSDSEDRAPQLRARVPDHVATGAFSSGAIVMTGPSEFVLDFVQTIGRPQRVAARVVLPHAVMPQFIDALRKNIEIYTSRFGPPANPVPPQSQQPGTDVRRPSPQEIYDELKIPDQLLSGAYANGVMIGHGPTEFSLDFLTSFFPQSAVSSRVFLSAGQAPRLLDSLQTAWSGLRNRGSNPGDGDAGTSSTPPS